MQRLVKVDGKVRTDINYPVGFMDVISIEKSDEHFRLLYDSKGRFVLHRLNNKNFSRSTSSSCAACSASRSVPRASPTSPPTTAAPSGTRILSLRCTTWSRWTLPLAKLWTA